MLPPPLRPLPGSDHPGRGAAEERLRAAGVAPSTWGNAPGDAYPAHEHPFEKLLVCAEGSITFLIGADETPVTLRAGEGFVLPAGTRHAALVGPEGCTCLEGHRAGGEPA